MSLDPDRTPVLVAASQCESRDLTLGPLELLETAAREALGAAPALGKTVQRLTVVNVLSRRGGQSPATDVATRLGLDVPVRETTNIGGNSPQLMVERAAADIAAGRLESTLIVGAEAVKSGLRPAAPVLTGGRAKARSGGATVGPSPAASALDPVIGVDRQDLSDEEHMAGLMIPLQVYPLFESVLACRAGRDPAQQREFIGSMMSPFTEAAAAHPHAWFRRARSPSELATPSSENRLVVEPYTKLMVAFLLGAQGAALVLTSLSVAQALGLDDGAVFVWSAATAYDVWNPMARPDLGRSAGLEASARASLTAAGVGADEIDLFDIYSCFPSAVQMGADVLGLPKIPPAGEPTRLSLTGGLPYFGGPGNNYTTHAIATMFERLRAQPPSSSSRGPLGFVNGVGWYMTKHSTGVYGTTPPPAGFEAADTSGSQARIDATALPCLALGEGVASQATVEASTVMYDGEGAVATAPVIASLDDGRRVAASAADGELAAVAGRFLVGARVAVEGAAGAPDGPRYRVIAQ